MKKYFITIFLMLFGFLPTHVFATSPPALATPAGLSFAEIKITGNEFILLQNNSGSTINDLSKYWLYDFNNINPLAAGVSSSTQQLPQSSLSDGQTIMLSSNGGATCGAAVTAKLSISLTDSGGYLEIVQTSIVNGVLTQTAGDSVSWSSGSNPTAGQISSVPTSASAPNAAYYRYKNPDNLSTTYYLWQRADVDSGNSCQLNVTSGGTTSPGPLNPGNQLTAGSPPPAILIDAGTSSDSASGLPLADVGLSSPQISEILPNPAQPQTDDEDEFIEIYNSNDKAFDLSGFRLQVGISTLHYYSFPSGTTIPAKAYGTYYSVDTNLAMSNSSGQVALLDPFSNIISQTDVYGSAKDGQSWALANGKWYWTSKLTPEADNIVDLTVPDSSTNKKSSSTSSSLSQKSNATSPNVTSAQSTLGTNATAPALHPLVLASVGLGAVAYAGYEYRNDLANRIYQLRRFAETRTKNGRTSKTTKSSRVGWRSRRWQNHFRSWLSKRTGLRLGRIKSKL